MQLYSERQPTAIRSASVEGKRKEKKRRGFRTEKFEFNRLKVYEKKSAFEIRKQFY